MDLISASINQFPKIRIKQKSDGLSKPQKLFNSLIDRISKQRELLAGWETAIPRFQQHFVAEMQPLVEQTQVLRLEFVRRLDWAYEQKGLSKTERRFVRDLLSDLAGELANETDNAEMKALYRKYVGVDFDQEEAEMMAEMKAIMEHELGMELGDDLDMRSPDAFFRQVQARLAQEQENHANAENERRTKRQKSAKQHAKAHAREEKLREEETRLTLSLREIYRKLASALHPDRELDPAERERKTALMQRVNQAYDKKNLLQLLELQMEVEHLDQTSINSLSEERLAHYNTMLKEQLLELEEQIRFVDYDFRMRFGIDRYAVLKPDALMRILERNIVLARQQLRDIESDLNAAQSIATLKALLKEMRRQQREDDFYDMPF